LRVVRSAADGRQIFIDNKLQQTSIRPDETVNFLSLNISIVDEAKTVQMFLNLSACQEDENFVGKCLSRKRWTIPNETLPPADWSKVWPLIWLDWQHSGLDGAEIEFEVANLLVALQGAHDLVGGHDGIIVPPSKLIGTKGSSNQAGAGIMALAYSDIDILLLPDSGAYRGQEICVKAAQGLLECSDFFSFAIIDSPKDASVGDALNFLDQLSGDAAVFYPWVEVDCPEEGDSVRIPPSGFVAGLFASIDPMGNPWISPRLEGKAQALRISVDAPEKIIDKLELERINILQVNNGHAELKGTERLLKAMDFGKSDKLQFIRLYQHIVKSIARHLSIYNFEPVTKDFLDDRRTEIERFLTKIWKSGILVGESAEEAFKVTFDDYEVVESGIYKVNIQLSLLDREPYGRFHINIGLPVYLDGGWHEIWPIEGV
jgi:hypothetical protein